MLTLLSLFLCSSASHSKYVVFFFRAAAHGPVSYEQSWSAHSVHGSKKLYLKIHILCEMMWNAQSLLTRHVGGTLQTTQIHQDVCAGGPKICKVLCSIAQWISGLLTNPLDTGWIGWTLSKVTKKTLKNTWHICAKRCYGHIVYGPYGVWWSWWSIPQGISVLTRHG
jgi:hypothetical protein